MTRDDYDPSCFGCGVPRTMNGFLCRDCYRERYGTIHPRWESLDYAAAVRVDVQRMDERNEQQYASKRRAAERKEAA